MDFKKFLSLIEDISPGSAQSGAAQLSQQTAATMTGPQPTGPVTKDTLQAGDQLSIGGNTTYPYQRKDPKRTYMLLAGDDMEHPIEVPINTVSAVWRGLQKLPFQQTT
jgi:hypothetical protein